MNALFSQFNYIIPKKDIQGNCLTLIDMDFKLHVYFTSSYISKNTLANSSIVFLRFALDSLYK